MQRVLMTRLQHRARDHVLLYKYIVSVIVGLGYGFMGRRFGYGGGNGGGYAGKESVEWIVEGRLSRFKHGELMGFEYDMLDLPSEELFYMCMFEVFASR